MTNLSIIDKLKRSKITDLLQEGKRIDDRALDESRPLVIDTGVIPHANGSARVRLGDTEIVSGIKVQPDKPFPDMGDKGIFICTAEILPLAHPSVETGPPPPDVIELARVVDRGIRESGMIDLSQLVLEKDKSVIGLFAMGYIMNLLSPYSSNAMLSIPPHYHLVMGSFLFGTVFMATEPVTGAHTDSGRWIFGILVGVLTVIIRSVNPAYPEGIMLAILLMNAFAPLIDYFVVQSNIKKRMVRYAQ